jgi:hypothetical protein
MKCLSFLNQGLLGLLLSPVLQVQGHHSWAPYDLKQEVKLTGVITEYLWANPHSYIKLDINRGETVWEIEASSAVVMRNRGWQADTVAVGDEVTIFANPSSKPKLKKALGARLVKTNGELLEMRQANPQAPKITFPIKGASSLAGQWRTTITPEIREHFFFFEPQDWPLTQAGIDAYNKFTVEDNPGKDCIAYASPFLMIIPDAKVVTMSEDKIQIFTELESVERVIHLNETTHNNSSPSIQGHSIGHWEGSVLVVETRSFLEHGMGNAQKLPSGPDKKLIERFELSADGQTINYSFEMSDPKYLTNPVSYKMDWVYAPDFELIRMPCNPQSAQRYLDLE